MRWRRGCVLVLAGLLCSCSGKEPPTAAGERGSGSNEEYEVAAPDLSADASPTQVAEALFAALDAEDEPRLRGIAARRAIHEDVNRLGRGRLRFSEAEAVELAVSGWQATYVFIEPGSTTVREERITENEASVLADCQNRADDRPRGLKVELAREKEGWRVLRLVPEGARPPARQ